MGDGLEIAAHSTMTQAGDCSVTFYSYLGLETYIIAGNLAKYLHYREKHYDRTRKWYWKKENKIFHIVLMEGRFSYVTFKSTHLTMGRPND